MMECNHTTIPCRPCEECTRKEQLRLSGYGRTPCSVPCPHQHPTTWKCKWDGLMKPEGMCKPHTFEHRPIKIERNGFHSSIRCMVAPNTRIADTGGANAIKANARLDGQKEAAQ